MRFKLAQECSLDSVFALCSLCSMRCRTVCWNSCSRRHLLKRHLLFHIFLYTICTPACCLTKMVCCLTRMVPSISKSSALWSTLSGAKERKPAAELDPVWQGFGNTAEKPVSRIVKGICQYMLHTPQPAEMLWSFSWSLMPHVLWQQLVSNRVMFVCRHHCGASRRGSENRTFTQKCFGMAQSVSRCEHIFHCFIFLLWLMDKLTAPRLEGAITRLQSENHRTEALVLTFPLGSKKGMGGFKKVVGRFKQHVGKINTWFPFSRGVLRKRCFRRHLSPPRRRWAQRWPLPHSCDGWWRLDVTCTTLELPKGHTRSRCMSHYVTIWVRRPLSWTYTY